MKIIRRIAIFFTVIMVFALVLFIYLNRQFTFKKRDLVYYNDLLHKAEEQLETGNSIENVQKLYNCEIILSKEINDVRLSEAYRNSAFVLDLTLDGEYAGKIVWTDELNNFDSAKRGFIAAAVLVWGVALIAGYLVIIYFYVNFIRRVEELEHFSAEVAKGNLEEPLPIHKNNIFGSFTEAFDIMREQLVLAREREIESQKARKELITELSHDIKTPVAVIKATCEVLEAQTAQGDGENLSMEKIEVISKKADTISELVSNMMHANLEDLEKLEVHPTEEDCRIISDYLESLKQYGNIILDNEIPGCLVYMDRIRMEQAIDNVVSNSYKYAGTDIHVDFESFTVEMPNGEDGKLSRADFLRIRIKDSGPGVPEEELPLICEKYYRGSNSDKAPGSGLGLYLVKYYMEKQGGGLEYYNDNGFVAELLLRKV